MIGGLVEEKDIGVGRQHLRERGTARFAPGQARGLLIPRQSELLEDVAGPVRIVSRSEARLDEGEGGGKGAEIRLLREISHGRTRLQEPRAAIRLQEAGSDLEKGGLAGAVASDEAGALAGGNRQFGTREQRGAAERERHVLQEEKRRSHGGFPLQLPPLSARRPLT